MSARDCRPYRAGRPHDFDPVSGWCVHGCGVRDDGRIVNTLTGHPVAKASERAENAPLPVEPPQVRPVEPPDLFHGHTAQYVDITQPRRGADQ